MRDYISEETINQNYPTHLPPPEGYEFYGNSNAKTKRDAIHEYSVYDFGVYFKKDLLALKNPYFSGYSVYHRIGAKNLSSEKHWRYRRSREKRNP